MTFELSIPPKRVAAYMTRLGLPAACIDQHKQGLARRLHYTHLEDRDSEIPKSYLAQTRKRWAQELLRLDSESMMQRIKLAIPSDWRLELVFTSLDNLSETRRALVWLSLVTDMSGPGWRSNRRYLVQRLVRIYRDYVGPPRFSPLTRKSGDNLHGWLEGWCEEFNIGSFSDHDIRIAVEAIRRL